VLFSSLTFLTIFLPTVGTLSLIVRPDLRNGVLLWASLLFYTWGSGLYVLVLVGSGLVAWTSGAIITRRRTSGVSTRLPLIASSVLLVAPLVYFKYASWFSENSARLASAVGIDLPTLSSRPLPIGISFFTFQALSYLFDVKKSIAAPQRRARDFILYLALFPQLIAGPIVRYSSVAAQISDRIVTPDHIARGLQRFAHGLAKKVIVADAVSQIADAAFGGDDLSTAAAWLGAIAYTIQIYFDFSGYSDMAIGLGMLFGFNFPENFDRPYSAHTITDFWRRWHITLSEWFRDYVYIPLGGNRASTGRQYVNLISVFALTALWHGAAWTFIIWGGLHALILVIERLTGRSRPGAERFAWIARARTALLVITFWVFFRAGNVNEATDMLKAMFTWQGTDLSASMLLALNIRSVVTLAVAIGVFFVPGTFSGFRTVQAAETPTAAAARPVLYTAMLVVSMAAISTGSLSPFLYFQF